MLIYKKPSQMENIINDDLDPHDETDSDSDKEPKKISKKPDNKSDNE